jgi:hypothetical protein
LAFNSCWCIISGGLFGVGLVGTNLFTKVAPFVNQICDLLKLSYDLRMLKPQLIELNEKRKKLQIDYSVLCNANNNKCQECKGLCCGGYYAPYFSAIDYLIRMFSDKPIDDYFNWWKPRPITSILIDKIKSIWVTSNHAHAAPDSICPNLTPIGCALEAEDRPIRCILWICNDLKKTIPPTDLRKMGVITRELSSISSEVLKCFEKPAHTCY